VPELLLIDSPPEPDACTLVAIAAPIVGVTSVGDVDSTSLPLPVFGETSVGGMMTEGMESGGFT
jgi:hypothetical protein